MKMKMVGLALALALTLVVVSVQTSSGQYLNLFSAASHSFCGPCNYKEACMGSLSSIAHKGMNASPKDFIETALQSTIQHVSSALHFSANLAANSSGSHKMWMEDCTDLLQSAVEELQECFSLVGATHLQTIQERQPQLLNWLSAVISYQHSCLDGIFDSNLKNHLFFNGGLSNANQLTSNALAVISSMSSFFNAFKLPTHFKIGGASAASNRGFAGLGTGAFGLGAHTHFGLDGGLTGGFLRRPYIPSTDEQEQEEHNEEEEEDDDDEEEESGSEGDTSSGGYPSWFSSRDRKLFESNSVKGLQPNAVVAKDGSGQFKTIGEALAAYPSRPLQGGARYVIYVKPGVYDEYLTVTKKQVNVFIYGDGPRKTIITGQKNFHAGISTFRTATFSAIGDGFIAKSIGFRNTAGPEGHQAVALRVQSDMSAFYNCRMDGYQDTLYVQTHRQFYRNCIISGTVDFIFGDAAAVLQNCLIIVRKPGEGQKNAVTAQGRVDKYQTTGIVIQNSKIIAEKKLYAERQKVPTYLGRPWKEYSRTVIMETQIEDLIRPEGWLEWNGEFALNTLYYAEYANTGAGAATDRRVKWRGYKVITDRNEALQFTPAPFLQGHIWLRNTGAPYFLGFKR